MIGAVTSEHISVFGSCSPFLLAKINMNKDINQFFESSDLALAAYLSALFPIESVDKSNPRKAIFLFKQTQELDKEVRAYWRGETRVEPRTYFDELRRIKSRLYADR